MKCLKALRMSTLAFLLMVPVEAASMHSDTAICGAKMQCPCAEEHPPNTRVEGEPASWTALSSEPARARSGSILYFRCLGHPCGGLVVTNTTGAIQLRTDSLGRIFPPREWLISGARLHVILSDGSVVDVFVMIDDDGLVLPIELPPTQGRAIFGALAEGAKIVIDHLWANWILYALGVCAAVLIAWLKRTTYSLPPPGHGGRRHKAKRVIPRLGEREARLSVTQLAPSAPPADETRGAEPRRATNAHPPA